MLNVMNLLRKMLMVLMEFEIKRNKQKVVLMKKVRDLLMERMINLAKEHMECSCFDLHLMMELHLIGIHLLFLREMWRNM